MLLLKVNESGIAAVVVVFDVILLKPATLIEGEVLTGNVD